MANVTVTFTLDSTVAVRIAAGLKVAYPDLHAAMLALDPGLTDRAFAKQATILWWVSLATQLETATAGDARRRAVEASVAQEADAARLKAASELVIT
jgi:hypothetical protein